MGHSENKPLSLDRRSALLLSATGGAALLTRQAQAADSTKLAAKQNTGPLTTPRSAVAKTQYGPVRGFVSGGVYTFKGIPYGANTGGENRWLPAKPPQPWTDEFPALVYGANCPQTLHNFRSIETSFLLDWDDGWLSEDMLKMNIWTPALTGKRPVMLYLHGGGFSFGSAYELPSHEGAQMARHHDVVQVSINHRLNALGFLDLSQVGGAAYAESGNVGMTDIVFALKWVRENIANFGGDPDRVMIYGQSGGASKVTTLMGMPSAAGLFHRAGVQSGGGSNSPTSEQQQAVARQLMVELGLGSNDITGLQKVEWQKLLEAGQSAVAKVNGPGPAPLPGSFGGPPRAGWSPTLDGRVLPVRAFYDVAPEYSKNVPMLVGSVSEEGMSFSSKPTESEFLATLNQQYPGKGAQILAAMKRANPNKSVRTLSYALRGYTSRNSVQRQARLKHNQGGAPAYQYWFTWQSPQLDGVAGAWHTAELAFCFDNTKRCEQGTGDTPQARALAKKMAGAWSAFAHTGNPGMGWRPSDPTRNQTMVFDNVCRMEDDPHAEVRKLIAPGNV